MTPGHDACDDHNDDNDDDDVDDDIFQRCISINDDGAGEYTVDGEGILLLLKIMIPIC